MPDQRWQELFGQLRSNRDRALLAIAISNGARAAELLGVRSIDVDWGEQLIRVHRKGSGAPQWLPASSESFVWLRLYLHDLGDPLQPQDPSSRTPTCQVMCSYRWSGGTPVLNVAGVPLGVRSTSSSCLSLMACVVGVHF